MTKRIHAIVTGLVQGVGFRASTADTATRLHLTGWVRNLPDDSVELEAEGPAATVDMLVAWCQHGPPSARVKSVTVDELAPTGAESAFQIVRW